MITKHFLDTSYNFHDVLNTVTTFYRENINPVIIITGPTSSGKTGLAHNLYSHLNSWLISCDSRQIYKYVSVGSNKPIIKTHAIVSGFDCAIVSDNEINKEKINYYLLDTITPDTEYSSQKYKSECNKIICTLHDLKILPIIVGGTTHWVKTIISNTSSPYVESNSKLYLDLCELDIDTLQAQYLEFYKRENVNDSDWNNKRRLSRAIEYYKLTGKSLYESTRQIENKNNYLIIQIQIDRKHHREKIRESVRDRIQDGWIEEVRFLINNYGDKILDKLGQGYRIIGNFIIDGSKMNKNELIDLVTISEMRYAKKQIIN